MSRPEHSYGEWVIAYRRLCKPLKEAGSEVTGPCPKCGDTSKPKSDRFHIKASGGKVLAGCRKCEIQFSELARLLFPAEEVGREMYPASLPSGVTAAGQPEEEPEEPEVYGCTLKDLAERTGLPVDFLSCLDIQAKDSTCWVQDHGEVPAVRIPYLGEDGEEIGAKFRVQVAGHDKYRYEKGSKAALYGLPMLPVARSKGKLFCVEGETDTITLIRHGIPAVGVPGSSSVSVLEVDHLTKIDTVYVIQEPDEAGSKFPAAVKQRAVELGYSGAVLRMRLPAKDPNALYLDNPQRFKARFLDIALHARGLNGTKVGGGMTAREITRAKWPEVNWIIPDILREGLGLLYSPPKAGKSHMALDIAVGVSQGVPVLGGWKTLESEVLVIDREEIIGDEMSRRLWTHGGSKDRNTLFIHDEWPRIGEGGMRELGWWLDDHPRCKLIIVDVWTNLKPMATASGGANAYDREYVPLQKLRQMMLKKGACILLVHHDKKTDGTGDVIDSASGTKALTGAANTIWRLSRKVGEVDGKLDITGRGVPERTLGARFEPSTQSWSVEKDISAWE